MATESKKKTGLIRLIVLILLAVAAFVLCLMRLMDYQVVKGDDFAKAAQATTETYETIETSRGEITDRYGRPLVTNKLALNLEIDRAVFSDEDKEKENAQINKMIYELTNLLSESGEGWVDTFPVTATAPYEFLSGADSDIAKLKKALNVQDYASANDCVQMLIKNCNIEGYTEEETRRIAGIRAQMLMSDWGNNNPYLFAEDVSSATSTKLMELGDYMPGVRVSESYVREYVSGTIAPHLIGSMSKIFAEEYDDLKQKGYKMNDTIGRDGVEKVMEDELRGTDGVMVVTKNKDGEIVDQYMKQEPQPGNTIMLTIDKNFQKEVQDVLENRVLQLRAGKYPGTKGAAATVLDVKTGEALALATYPTYDINQYKTNYSELLADPLKPLMNRALNELYRPGSTFKTVMTVAGVSEGKITPTRQINCQNPYRISDREFRCQQYGHRGLTNIYTALEHSCNIYFYQVGEDLGEETVYNYAHAMGMGEKTGLEIKNAVGRVSSKKTSEELGIRWNIGDICQTAIGQSETYITPLQMAISTMVIANKGTRYETHLIKSVEKYDYSSTIKATEPVVLGTLEDKNNAFEIDTEGMKLMAETVSTLKGKNVAAKSGTPQKTETITHSAAVAFYPADNPEIAISIMIEEGENAKETVGDIIDAYNRTKTQKDALPQSKEVLIVK